MTAIESLAEGCRIHLHVAPRASRTRVMGLYDGRVKLAVAAPPVEGRANDEIVKFLARALAVGRDAIRFVSGETGKRKTVVVAGLDAADAIARLELPTTE